MHKNYSNFTDILSEQTKVQPQAIAIYTSKGSLTYKELDISVWKMSTFLNHNDVRSGDVLALTFKNELAIMITMLAIARIGATVFSIPVDTPKIQNDEMLMRVKVKFITTDIAENQENSLPVLLIELNTFFKEKILINFNVRDSSPTSPWLLISGSGSTGKSKIMPVHHTQQIQRMRSSLKWLSASKDDRVATLVHLDHHVSKRLYLEALNTGSTIVIFSKTKMNPLSLYKIFKITILHATVFHIQQIFKVFPEGNNLMSSLKVLLVGGSSVQNSLRKEISERLTKNLYVRYGINEVGTISAAHSPTVYNTIGTVGQVLPEMLVEIVDPNFQILQAEKVGLIRIKSPTTISGYMDNEEANKRAFKEGWFYPGDLGKFTSDGQLIHLGRADNMMIMAGNNIYPSEIEQCMTSHPNVEDAVAMPIKSSKYQEVPVCAVTLKNGKTATKQELFDFTYQHLGKRGPQIIVILDVMPRNEQGKLINTKLIEKIRSILTSQDK